MSQHVFVVAKRTAYARYVEDAADAHVQALLDRKDAVVSRWRAAHEEHQQALEVVQEVLQRHGARVTLVLQAHAKFDPTGSALVVVVGGDGTALAASHNVTGVPILGVNSAPGSSVGFFCPARGAAVPRALAQALNGELAGVTLQRMKVTINGQLRSNRVLNEALYCHASPAATSRYILKLGEQQEEQRSSGFWIGPAAGSTAAQYSAGGRVLPLQSKKLQLVVREPWAPQGKRIRMRRLLVTAPAQLTALSKMAEANIFLDGPWERMPIFLGDEVCFALSDDPLTVLGITAARKRIR